MKFLCVPCDSPMTLQTLSPPKGGSLSVVYACPECGYEMAMLTNAYETQLVQSLGVRIGPDIAGGALAGPAGAPEPGKCPFPGMISSAPQATGANGSAAAGPTGPTDDSSPVRWTDAAEARLANIPAFVRPMARTGIERYARERGSQEVDETILDAARDFFGM